jgi:protein gp37
MAERFYPGLPGGKFSPHFFPLLLDEPAKRKKPAKIFVCSMGDLFGDWVLDQWILAVLQVAKYNPKHTFQFLTKNPKRLKDFNPWPTNCWVGTTVTNQADADERLPWLLQVDAPVRFVSHEPLLGAIEMKKRWLQIHTEGQWLNVVECGRKPESQHLNWAIIGAMTGPGAVHPSPDWVNSLMGQYEDAGVPVFLKDNLYLPGVPAHTRVRGFPK